MATNPTITRPDSAQEAIDWRAAMAAYAASRLHLDNVPAGASAEEVDAASDASDEALAHLILNVPAPDMGALLEKLEMARKSKDDYAFDEFMRAIKVDIERLAFSPAHDTSTWDAVWAGYERMSALLGACDPEKIGDAAYDAIGASYTAIYETMMATPAPTAEALARKIVDVGGDFCPTLIEEARSILAGNHPLAQA